MIMQDQSKRLSEPLRWGRREKRIVATLLACVALVAVGLGAFALTSGAPARKDCIEVNFASTLGGATEHACGAQARRVCATPGAFRHLAAELPAILPPRGLPVRLRPASTGSSIQMSKRWGQVLAIVSLAVPPRSRFHKPS